MKAETPTCERCGRPKSAHAIIRTSTSSYLRCPPSAVRQEGCDACLAAAEDPMGLYVCPKHEAQYRAFRSNEMTLCTSDAPCGYQQRTQEPPVEHHGIRMACRCEACTSIRQDAVDAERWRASQCTQDATTTLDRATVEACLRVIKDFGEEAARIGVGSDLDPPITGVERIITTCYQLSLRLTDLAAGEVQRSTEATTRGGCPIPEDEQAATDLLARCPWVPPEHVPLLLGEATRALMFHRTKPRTTEAMPTTRCAFTGAPTCSHASCSNVPFREPVPVEESELLRQVISRYTSLGEIRSVVESDLRRIIAWARRPSLRPDQATKEGK